MIRVLELFAGIGACSKALTNLGIEHEIVDAVEINKYAIKSFNAIHGTNFEPQDITTWDKDIECDLIMHGSPCQDFSVAGRGAGGDKDSGTRSSLMYETLRIVEKVKPKYVIWENVKNLLSKKHRHNFDAYLDAMYDLGYINNYKVLNAKDYGIPQNRERVFTVSILQDKIIYDDYNSNVRKDQDTIGTLTTNCGAQASRNGWKVIEKKIDFIFPEPQPLEIRLKDILENNVDERYYLSDEQVFKIKLCDISKTVRTGGRGSLDRHSWDIVPEPCAMIKTANSKGYDLATDGDGIDLGYPNSTTRRGRVGHGVAKTLPTSGTQGTLDDFRIRKLTPRECWRLMGFSDADFDKAKAAGISDTQLYKQAGNSIVVECLEAIFKSLEWPNMK